MTIVYEIVSSEEYDDDAEIVPIYGQGCNYETRKGVDGYHITFKVLVDLVPYEIIFQSMDRHDNMMAYNGFEMRPGTYYGCDADESQDLLEAYEESEAVVNLISKLQETARDMCEAWFNQHIGVEQL